MSPARQHRDRYAKAEATTSLSDPIDPAREDGQAPAAIPVHSGPVTAARAHHERVTAAQAAIAENPDDPAPLEQLRDGIAAIVAARPAVARSSAEAQIALRLTHDLRRLKEIKSVERKIDAKREMLPAYSAWVDGVLEANAGTGDGIAAEVVPTIMLWSVDVGDYDRALQIGAFVLAHKVTMPARYERDAATILVEEIATAALKDQAAGKRFPLRVLEAVEEMTAGDDMHDQVRAKLVKAIGVELFEAAMRVEEAGVPAPKAQADALAKLQIAHRLNDRIGVKDKIKRLEKALGVTAPEAAPAA